MSAIEQPAARSGRITCCSSAREDVGALGHEVNAAEHDELGVRLLADLTGELERIAGVVGELHHLVALIVMAENDETTTERRFRRGDAAIHLLVREAEIVLGQRLPLSDVCFFVVSDQRDEHVIRDWDGLKGRPYIAGAAWTTL